MEDGSGEDGVGRSIDKPLPEMLERAGATGGDDGNGHRSRDGPRQLEIVAVLGAVAVHAGQEYLAGSEPRRLARPLHRVAPGWSATAVSIDFPSPNHFTARLVRRTASARTATRVDGHHDALTAEPFGGLADELGSRERRRVERDLVGPGPEKRADVLDAPDAPAHRERHVDPFGRPGHDVEHDLPVLVGGRDVEEDQFVGALGVVGLGGRHGITGVAQIDEAHALHDTAVLDVETRDDALGQHARAVSAWRRSMAPVYRARPTTVPITPAIAANRRKSSSWATPPEARTGISTARARASVCSTFGPCSVPSRVMSVYSSAAAPASRARIPSSAAVVSTTSVHPFTATRSPRASTATMIRPGNARHTSPRKRASNAARVPTTAHRAPALIVASTAARSRNPPPTSTGTGATAATTAATSAV